jgi:murein DD-endopeptidase MepM/ murein hydrolase activator NlpD
MKSIFDGRGSIATFLARTFAPREIILRANGRLSYLRLSSGLQKSAVAVMALLAGWSVYASAGYFVHRDGVADRDRQIELRDLAYLDLETRFGQALARETRLEKRVAGLGLSLQRGFEITAALRQEREDLKRRNDGLWEDLVSLREVQQGVLNQFSDRVTLRADFVERTVALTGLDPDKLVHDSIASRLGKGGPLIPVGKVAADLGPESGFVAAVDGLNEQWSRWTALQEAVRTLPLAAPLDQYWVSSSFGERKDPITGEVARHEGLDIVAPLGARVLAPAPGTVVVAERHKRFGRLIEIDHGRGLTTRYAHLSKILVEVGQQVEHRQEIGVMGSSGRSTGPHVHYEVRYRDQPLDPEKFLMAGWRLFKG